MQDDMFDKLTESIEQATAHMKGEKDLKEDQIHYVDEPDPRAIRDDLGLTQREFADLLNVSVDTVRNWEQGRRQPQKAAEMLLRIADRNPQTLLDAHASPEEMSGGQAFEKVRYSTQRRRRVLMGNRGESAVHRRLTIQFGRATSTPREEKRDVRSADDYSYAMAV
jgi:putative transcriptional regulator